MMRWEKQNASSEGLDDAQSEISSTVEFSILFYAIRDRCSWKRIGGLSGDDLGASGLYISLEFDCSKHLNCAGEDPASRSSYTIS